MKRIGIIAGLSPETTPKYCTGIDQYINRIKGGHSSADMVIRTVDFDVYYDLMQKGSWDYISHLICEEAALLAGCHCTYVAIASNTMHKIADEVELTVDCDPERFHEFVHIGDAIANKCQRFGAKRVAVLGTKFTMTEDFLKKRLRENGLKVVDGFIDNTIAEVDRIIFDELGYGKVYESRLSNGPIESINRKVKDLKRSGRGYRNFEHFRNRFLYAARQAPILNGTNDYTPVLYFDDDDN